MMNRKLVYIIFLIIGCHSLQAQKWSFEVNGGYPVNVPLPLVIKQQGYEPVKLRAKYFSEPFISPYYWVWRFSRWKNGRGLEFEAIHHKVYISNPAPEIQRFSISHGLNLLNFSFARQLEYFIARAGAGAVLAHAENTIRNQKLDEKNGIFSMGYYLSGFAVNMGIQRKFYLNERLFGSLELKISDSYCRVPVAGGHADVFNLFIQGIFGVGVVFCNQKETS